MGIRNRKSRDDPRHRYDRRLSVTTVHGAISSGAGGSGSIGAGDSGSGSIGAGRSYSIGAGGSGSVGAEGLCSAVRARTPAVRLPRTARVPEAAALQGSNSSQ
jgi:hypothetical protein